MGIFEVRQCQDASDKHNGAIAIKHGYDRWQVVHGTRTSFVADDAVASWHKLDGLIPHEGDEGDSEGSSYYETESVNRGTLSASAVVVEEDA